MQRGCGTRSLPTTGARPLSAYSAAPPGFVAADKGGMRFINHQARNWTLDDETMGDAGEQDAVHWTLTGLSYTVRGTADAHVTPPGPWRTLSIRRH